MLFRSIEEKSEVDWKSQQQVSKPPASKVNIKYFMRSIFRDKKTSSEAFIVKEIKEEPSFNIKQSNKPRFSLCVGNPAIINEEVENKTSNKKNDPNLKNKPKNKAQKLAVTLLRFASKLYIFLGEDLIN